MCAHPQIMDNRQAQEAGIQGNIPVTRVEELRHHLGVWELEDNWNHSRVFIRPFLQPGAAARLVVHFKRTHSRSRSSFLIFLASLVVTDFMGLLVTGSIVISFHVTHFNWAELDPRCHFCNFMGMSMVFYGLCPLLLGATMAVERFVGINRPFAHSTHMSKSRAMFTVLLVWVFAGSISLLPVAGLGSYHLQMPGSWCFLNISSQSLDMFFCLIFSLVGLLSLILSFVLNTVSVVTLLRVCCGPDSARRQRNHEVEMMVQLILIMAIASICWCPLL
ncbi:hypothetical protein Z043_123727, partial [Scleropages formosus]